MNKIKFSLAAKTALDGSDHMAVLSNLVSAGIYARIASGVTALTNTNPEGDPPLAVIPLYDTSSNVTNDQRATVATVNTALTALVDNTNEVRRKANQIAEVIGIPSVLSASGTLNDTMLEVLATPIATGDANIVAGTPWQSRIPIFNRDIFTVLTGVNKVLAALGEKPIDLSAFLASPALMSTNTIGFETAFTNSSAAGPTATAVSTAFARAAANYRYASNVLNNLRTKTFSNHFTLGSI
jgi:hypothetical protein